MKRLLLLLALATTAVLVLHNPECASAQGACGLPPGMAPIGCVNAKAVCQCAQNGTCWWVWVCD